MSAPFAGEEFLAVQLPDYASERTLTYLFLAIASGLTLVYFPTKGFQVGQSLPHPLNGLITPLIGPLAVILFLVTFSSTLLYHNPHNTYPLRRVFRATLFSLDECQELLAMADKCAQRNLELFGNSTPELYDHPAGWFKTRDPIYPTTDLHFLLEPFTDAERRRLAELLDRRLAPIVSRVYGIPTSALRVNDMFVVRYDQGQKIELRPHTDTSDISFNILLNHNFTQGGTEFYRRHDQGQEPFILVQPEPGELLMHASHLLHKGYPITSGTRIILVGFFSVDRLSPLTEESTGLPLLASYGSLPWMSVKLKDSYTFSDRRSDEGSGDAIFDHVYAQALRRDFFNFVKLTADMVGEHELVTLVDRQNYTAYRTALDQAAQGPSGVHWFWGQHLDIGFSGRVAQKWKTRHTTPEKFQLEL